MSYVVVSYAILYNFRHKFTLQAQQCYHCFAHPVGDVVSNLGFLVVGVYHAYYWDFFFGIYGVMVALGSTYYHLNPTKETLFWDRFPMVVELSCVLSMALDVSFWPLYLFNFAALVLWDATNNLLLYAACQLAPCLMLGIHGCYGMRLVIFFYFLAKLAEDNDKAIWQWTRHTISGHTCKHLLAALAMFLIPFNNNNEFLF